MTKNLPTLALVGPCASGKSTLITELEKKGYKARHIAQEHSFVPDMWRKLSKPDVLIYLDVSYGTSKRRQGIKEWPHSIYQQQVDRLRHAYKHADFFLNTNNLTPEEVLQKVLFFLQNFD